MIASPSWGQDSQTLEITDPLPYRPAPIDYFGKESNDAVVELKRRIERGDVEFKHRGSTGYLLDLLKALEIPIESQTLVFSKTSVHQRMISPKNPRAIYFNDEVSVGWVPGAPVLEIAAQDPLKGAMFYTLSQSENVDPAGKLTWRREDRCLTCHVSTTTLSVPGLMLRSFQVNERGEPQSGYSQITHATPFEKRWGGWFVTGRAEQLVHAGNLFGSEDIRRHQEDASFRGALPELTSLVDLSKYPSGQSDIVALMVLDHQMHFYDLVTRVQYEHRLDRHSDAEEQLARYALMEEEAPLPGRVTGASEYSKWYQSVGARDSQGRSLRDLNLKTRLFEHRLSPMIHSRSFQCLPDDLKLRLWDRFRKATGDLLEAESPH